MRTGSVQPRSDPLPGFRSLSAVYANSSFAALFHAATSPGALPSERSPHRDRGPLPRPPATLQLSPRVSSDVIARGLPADVSPTPASPRLPGSSSTRDALSAEQVQPSRSPQPQATRVSPPASLLCFVALFPPRVRSRRPKLPSAAGRCSLGVLPLQRPFRASEPRAHLQPHDWNSA
jgi:hypothetical protein